MVANHLQTAGIASAVAPTEGKAAVGNFPGILEGFAATSALVAPR
jgi:hypothetical protein